MTTPLRIEHHGIPGRASLASLLAAVDNIRGYAPAEALAVLLSGGPHPQSATPLRLRMSRTTADDFREALRRNPSFHPSTWQGELVHLFGHPVLNDPLPDGVWHLEETPPPQGSPPTSQD